MTILQIHKFFWHRDGASNYFLHLRDLLQDAGHHVIPFSMHHPSALESPYSKYFIDQMDLDNPASVSFLNKIKFTARMFYNMQARKRMGQLLNDHEVNVVHLHNIYHHISPSILPVIKQRNVPIIMTLHDYKLICPNYSLFHHGAVHEEDCAGWYSTCVKNKCMKDSRLHSTIVRYEMIFHHKIMKYYERYIDKFIAPSQFMIDLCVKYGWPREKFVHIPNVVPSMEFQSRKEGSHVVYVGRLSEEKGLHVLLAAAAMTSEIPYMIVGTGPQEAWLRSTLVKNKIENVTMTGFLSGSDLQKVRDTARFYVLPAIWYENNPLSVLEASAQGKITLASAIGGLPEILPAECLCQPADPAAFAALIKKWYDDPTAKRSALGKKLQQHVRTHNNPQKHLEQILAVYGQSEK